MKKVLLCLLGIVILIIENSMTNYISIFGVSIDFILIYLTIISLYLDEFTSGIMGLVIGLVKDITVGGVFGVHALIYFSLCYLISFLRKKIYKESKVTIFTLIIITTIFSSLINILTSIVVYSSYTNLRLVLRGIVMLPLLNSFIGLILYRLFDKSILKLKED
ncbi:MAG: rod shape-determining protein MreD [Terrisporobacter sp.]|uniref:rod shape-determining protein MreD n=1 Tax=Terrisporobacter sp. TaxID=1965305 RepID=UPI002FCC240F